MTDPATLNNIKYYGAYQLVFVATVIILSSLGAFFHFLLDHEISIVEAWLHNNQWEILIAAKLLSLYLLSRWFRVKLYELKSVRQLMSQLIRWPDKEAGVVAVFIAVSYLVLGGFHEVGQNTGYWYFHVTSFLGLFLFFGIEFVVIAYLDDILNEKQKPNHRILGVAYTALFILGFKISVPDYYGLLHYVFFCYTMLLLLSGASFKKWSNVVCLLAVFIAPMGSLFGLDPVWGDDFSPLKVRTKVNLTFLAAIWMISFCYYRYRESFITSARKFMR